VTVPSLEEIRDQLAAHEPRQLEDHEGQRAAVAMVLRDGAPGLEVLFIERAQHERDPWSGHMAFPGGRVDPSDTDTRAAAERETLEEVGLSLAQATLLGRLDDKTGNPATAKSLVISAYVYHLAASTAQGLVLNEEVAAALWFPVNDLLEQVHHVPYVMRQYDNIKMPGILVGEPERHIVWGLTYNFVESFFVAVGEPLPDHWEPGTRRYDKQRMTGSGG